MDNYFVLFIEMLLLRHYLVNFYIMTVEFWKKLHIVKIAASDLTLHRQKKIMSFIVFFISIGKLWISFEL